MFFRLAQSQLPASENTDSSQSLPEIVQEIRTKFDILKIQYSAFVKVMQNPLHEPVHPVSSPLPFTPEEDLQFERQTAKSHSAGRASLRNSMATSNESFVEWFDAEDEGPQEFTMDLGPELSEPGSRLLPMDDDNSSVNTDIGQYERLASPVPHEVVHPGKVQVVRRTQLPCLPQSDEGSLFTILKKNVGKAGINCFPKIVGLTSDSGYFYSYISRYI